MKRTYRLKQANAGHGENECGRGDTTGNNITGASTGTESGGCEEQGDMGSSGLGENTCYNRDVAWDSNATQAQGLGSCDEDEMDQVDTQMPMESDHADPGSLDDDENNGTQGNPMDEYLCWDSQS
ncbi:hypothetical protein L208DRAFT_1380439 [Tricholoma matsutake]|nr:hypothetical protein L208DRAFT_1380439 [Tricholoma matsutake 945]